MANPNAIVSTVLRLDPPPGTVPHPDDGFSVELEGERRVRLAPDDPRSTGLAQVLDGARKRSVPVYLEVDPESSVISRVLVPFVTRVIEIRPIDVGVLGVELERSHGRHVLRSSSPDFEELERQVREALVHGDPVILTEDDAHEIIDVRELRPGLEEPPPPFPRPDTPPRLPWPWRWIRDVVDLVRCCWCPWLRRRCVSERTAQKVFDAMAATSCAPLTVPPPCIPFLYPDDGCWGRAHEMCRLMIAMGRKPMKVWIQGSLYVSTKNTPNCGVWWGWHVAPTLCVRGPALFQTREMVIDPSLFTTPVTKAVWKGVQGDPNATLTASAASIFYLWGSVTDPTYTQTNQVLADYRLKLQARAVQQGPPPYANCP
jgi:hypothetical protein